MTVSASGGTGSLTGTGVVSSQAAGNRTYTVTDDNSCSASKTIAIAEPQPLTATAVAAPLACVAGSLTDVTVT